MSSEPSGAPPTGPTQRRWQPIGTVERRVAGVLAEKAKTTPDIYPMSLAAICTGCNQKNNRWPLMQLEPDQVEEALDRLRAVGAVGLVEGYGRVQKYRHYLYDWLGVDKVELAVMTELLLRGDQTVGELRGRTSRMEHIADLAALKPLLESLQDKGLLVSLTPEGRGQVVTHALYTPREMESLRAKYQGGGRAVGAEDASNAPAALPVAAADPAGQPTRRSQSAGSQDAAGPPPALRPADPSLALRASVSVVEALGRELSQLQERVAQLDRDMAEMRDTNKRLGEQLQELRDALGG
jgi:uncharacterized protein YceH (UPF0502 family)